MARETCLKEGADVHRKANMMKTSEHVVCRDFPCADVVTDAFTVPDVEVDPQTVRIAMISEVPPADAADFFYAPGSPLYAATTVQAFQDAGARVNSMQDILSLGAYATTAVKCAKMQYAVSTETIKNCSALLEREMALFPNVQAYVLNGDVAIRAMNEVWRRQSGSRVVPAGSTYKIRKQELWF
jgi:hypothetical protein